MEQFMTLQNELKVNFVSNCDKFYKAIKDMDRQLLRKISLLEKI